MRGADRALVAIASLGLMAMMLHICLDIGASLLLNAPIATTSAIVTSYYMIAVAFLPIYTAEVRNGHIGVNLVTATLPVRVQNWLDMLMLSLTAGSMRFLPRSPGARRSRNSRSTTTSSSRPPRF
ncbi:TRAP transporter small permease [Seohaeicola zhoushanensis]